jgi:uncharacterized glyoxalase superfamily protein PhnB
MYFSRTGQYRKALEWYQRALDGREKIFGRDHPSTFTTVHNKALVFQSQGEYIKALEWYQRSFDSREKTLGRDHRETVTTVDQMAVAKDFLSNLTSAEINC